MYPNVQAYDRGVMFNPDGRLFQVEYAKEAVRKGATALGFLSKKGVVFVAHKNIAEPLSVPGTIQKVFRVDSHIGATYSGMVADGIHIVNYARSQTQNHRFVYNDTKSIESLVKELSYYMMQPTLYGGTRPYAISMLIGGFDGMPRLFEIGPDAAFLGYKADAIGIGKKTAIEMLQKEYKDTFSTEDCIELGVKIIKKVHEGKSAGMEALGKLSVENVEIGYIEDPKDFVLLSANEINKYL
jgi:proteasome alpha subunit